MKQGDQDNVLTLIRLLLGLGLLFFGGDGLVKGASRLAQSISISPLIIGLTVVAIGTSAPELMVSLGAHMDQKVI